MWNCSNDPFIFSGRSVTQSAQNGVIAGSTRPVSCWCCVKASQTSIFKWIETPPCDIHCLKKKKKKKSFSLALKDRYTRVQLCCGGGGAWQSLVLFFGSIPPPPLWASCSGLWWACNVQCTTRLVYPAVVSSSLLPYPLPLWALFPGGCMCVCAWLCMCALLGTAWWTWSTVCICVLLNACY